MLHGPAGLAVFSCGIRLTPLEAVTDNCSLPKNSKKPSIGSVSSISSPFRKGTSFSHVLLPSPFRTTCSYFDNSVSIGPASVGHDKWMLSRHPSVCAKCWVDTLNHCRVSYLSVLSGGPERTIFQINMLVVPREKYPEMDWRAADKVATWKLFKRCMKVIFVADQIPEERQYALILVAGGDKAYNCLDTLEDTVENVKDPEQVWNAFEKSFKQSTSFWHFRDAYLADFRQDPME